ncbi:MAG: sigma 54-interacting transcriptional regulator [Flammeovirgaceae bacterium]
MINKAQQRARILYVDDEPENLTGFKFVFRKAYEIYLANSGAEALEILAEKTSNGQPIQLVITDQRMPKMRGVDLLEQVALNYPDTMRMIVTGYSDMEAVMDAINKGGAFRYLTKPWEPEHLTEAIEQALQTYRLRVENAHLVIELKESERKLTTLLGNLQGMAFRSIMNRQRSILFTSDGCYDLTGYHAVEFTSNKVNYGNLIDPEHLEKIEFLMLEAVNKDRAYEVHYPIKTVDGEIKWVLEKGIKVEKEEDGAVILEGFIADITDRKKAEENLETALAEVKKLKEKVEEENLMLRQEIKIAQKFDTIVTQSTKLKKVLKQVEQVAISDATVLILGETGTGKELLAKAVHHHSKREKKSFVKVNCAALPANLIESELFGHEKGAFTGAISQKVGRFELAHKGSIFLDEIGELPLELQAKLLRVLQEGELERLGSTKTLKVDVRVIAATNRDLQKEVEKGNFRADLYYRLNVFPLNLPPLRERQEDIPLLVEYFVNKYAPKIGKTIKTIPKKQLQKLETYPWPGNIRELENIIERSVIISTGNKLEVGDWLNINAAPIGGEKMETLEDNEKKHILKALKMTSWRVSGEKGAAKLLDINDRTLQSRIKKLGIKRPGME